LLHQGGALDRLQSGALKRCPAVLTMPLGGAMGVGLMAADGTAAAQGMATGLTAAVAQAGLAQ
jgi:hypothetical protein